MSRSLVLLLLACLLAAAAASYGRCGDFRPAPVILPTERDNTKVTLTVRAGRVSIPLETKDDGEEVAFEYTGRFYEMDDSGPMLPGPTLKVNPGGKIVLTLVNGLGNAGTDNATMNMPMNRFHGPNVTNVHFHGMHSDPKKDDPFTVMLPGETHVYKISVPRDHEPGLHWYHTHAHGAVYYQLMGGLFGAIDVGEGDFMTTPVHPFRGWDSQLLFVHLYRLGPSKQCDGMPLAEMDTEMGSYLASDPRIVDKKGKTYPLPPDLYLVNGQHRPTVTVRQNHPMLLRIAYAAGSCYLNISLPAACTFHVTAVDGVQVHRTREVVERWQYFTTATRRGLAVVCHEVGVFPVHHVDRPDDVLFYIRSEPAKRNGRGKALDVSFPVTLPKYSPDYLYLKGSQQFYREISLSQRDLPTPKPYYVLGQGTDCRSLQNSSSCFYEYFQGQIGDRYEGYHGFMVPLHTVVTARVYGDPTDLRPHPFHFHVNHFQVVSFEPRVGGLHENHTLDMYGVRLGEFRDTVPMLDGVTVIRWQASTYVGEVVYHCHALHHEDRGMMVSYLVYSPLDANGKAIEKIYGRPSSDGWEEEAPWLRRYHVYILVGVFLLASAAALAWRAMRHRGIRSLSDAHQAFASRADAGTDKEHIPLLPRS